MYSLLEANWPWQWSAWSREFPDLPRRRGQNSCTGWVWLQLTPPRQQTTQLPLSVSGSECGQAKTGLRRRGGCAFSGRGNGNVTVIDNDIIIDYFRALRKPPGTWRAFQQSVAA